jgi:UDP-glucose 4-epimerase
VSAGAAELPDPGADFQTNAFGTFNVGWAASELGKPLLNVSTSEVYGVPRQRPIEESHAATPVSPYGASKLAGEIACHTIARVRGGAALTLRIFSVYGPAANLVPRATVETIFLREALAGRPPVINASPQTGRDFVFVSDVMDALVAGLERVPAVNDRVVNIGSGVYTSLLDLARTAVGMAGLDAEPVVQYDGSAPTMAYQADISRARELLGFSPKVQLADGLRRIVEQLRSSNAAPA